VVAQLRAVWREEEAPRDEPLASDVMELLLRTLFIPIRGGGSNNPCTGSIEKLVFSPLPNPVPEDDIAALISAEARARLEESILEVLREEACCSLRDEP